jgi:hypothetical protein
VRRPARPDAIGMCPRLCVIAHGPARSSSHAVYASPTKKAPVAMVAGACIWRLMVLKRDHSRWTHIRSKPALDSHLPRDPRMHGDKLYMKPDFTFPDRSSRLAGGVLGSRHSSGGEQPRLRRSMTDAGAAFLRKKFLCPLRLRSAALLMRSGWKRGGNRHRSVCGRSGDENSAKGGGSNLERFHFYKRFSQAEERT